MDTPKHYPGKPFAEQSKKYRTRYLDELKVLYGEAQSHSTIPEKPNPIGVESTIE